MGSIPFPFRQFSNAGSAVAAPAAGEAGGGSAVEGPGAAQALLSGFTWGGSVTFAFTDSAGDYPPTYPGAAPLRGFQAFTDGQAEAARAVLAEIAAVSGLSFTEATDSDSGGGYRTTDPGDDDDKADIRLARTEVTATAYAYYPGPFGESGDVWLRASAAATDAGAMLEDVARGGWGRHTLLHEIGHAVGLKHGHHSGGTNMQVLPVEWDGMEFTVMSYRSYVGAPVDKGYGNEYWGFAQSLMMLDIAALQQAYGANHATRAGDTVYRFDPVTGEMSIDGVGQGAPGDNRLFLTIWDGDGVDAYDFSAYATDLSIDLAPGGWCDLDVGGTAQRAWLGDGHWARGHVFNALMHEGDPRSLIENARGGSGNDVIRGNLADNSLVGAGGNDILDGLDGDDMLWGGSGDDSLTGGTGFDRLFGGRGDDHLDGGAGDDRLLGRAGDDVLTGGDGRDALRGGEGADSFVFRPSPGGRMVVVDLDPLEDRLILPEGLAMAEIQAVERGDLRLFIDDAVIRLVGWHVEDLGLLPLG